MNSETIFYVITKMTIPTLSKSGRKCHDRFSSKRPETSLHADFLGTTTDQRNGVYMYIRSAIQMFFIVTALVPIMNQ